MNKLIDRLEKGHLYKVKEHPNWDNMYTIFCPNRNRIIRYHDDYRNVYCIFTINGYGKNAKLEYKNAYAKVSSGWYVKHLSISDYIKVNTLLKREGYKFDKKNLKLVKVNG